MVWQDFALTGVSVVFFLTLFPALLDDETSFPRWRTSVPMALGLYVITFVYATMSFWFSSGMALLTAFTWSGIAIFRPIE